MERDFAPELRRQLLHIACGTAAAVLIAMGVVDWRFFLSLLAAGIILSLAHAKIELPVIVWLLKMFERKNAAIPGKGALSLVGGVLLALLLFEKQTALAAIMVVTFGDSFSHLFGKLLGRTKHPFNKYKLMEGSLAGFVAASLAAAFFVSAFEAVAASAVAMLVEGFELKFRKKSVDDNLVVPLVAGAVITVMQLL